VDTNRSLGQQVHDALIKFSQAKSEAMRARRRADRILDVAMLKATGKNAEERKASARQDPVYDEADIKAVEAECAAIVAKSEADGLQCEFDEWRTRCATERAEMNLR
jgi:hypothetical protein